MTTTVKIEAHCPSTHEVVIEVEDGHGSCPSAARMSVLQDGERQERYAYDTRKITVYERKKEA